MSRNKLRPATNQIWGYPLPHQCSLMSIIFVAMHVSVAICLFKHITISWLALTINQLQICLKIHILDWHFVSTWIIFTLFFLVVRTLKYLLCYPIIYLFYIPSWFILLVLTICRSCLRLLTFGFLPGYSTYLPWNIYLQFELLGIAYILRWIGAPEYVWTCC